MKLKYAVRLNSFLSNSNGTVLDAISDIGAIKEVTYVDLNYPEHFEKYSVEDITQVLYESQLKVHAINMRFRAPYLNGAFSNNNDEIRRAAVQLTQEAVEICKKLNGTQVIVWLAYDGYDYSFQMDYNMAWNRIVNSFKEVCEAVDFPISIEYKPYEERGRAILDNFGTTVMMLKEVGSKKLGVTLDFCHMLMNGENPAFAAAYLLDKKLLYAVHMNDGEGQFDNGLITGMVNTWKTLEIIYYLKKYNYTGTIYFDTFPRREKASEEVLANIKMFESLAAKVDEIGTDKIDSIVKSGNAIYIQKFFCKVLA